MSVIIETSIGDLTVDLYTEERPRCAKNFLKLCKVKYYNFSLFYSVQQNLVAQTGDPTATGKGGESVYGMVYGEQARYFDLEVSPRIKHKKRGLLSMVNNGNGKHGSQFFITLGEDLDYLDGVHTVFGEVAEGFEVLDKLNEAYCDEKHRPYRDIRIFHTVILDDPYDDPDGLQVPDKSPGPTQEMLKSDRIGVDEEVDDTKGMTEEAIREMVAEREAKANAQLLEMVGDLPDVDVKPPDNVLFVCKLNPVTTDEDLEMIFSRFGPISTCEVIKDHKTKESLQYAFIEFEQPEHCENAYFKMDNVLIDDRRIHVDFSQSVSKLQHNAKGQASNPKEDKEDEDKPKYVLKDQQRKDDRYDLVYEHDDLPDDGESSKKKKQKKHKHRKHSDSEDDNDSKDKKKKKSKKHKHSRSQSRSPVRKEQLKSRSRSPDRRDRRDKDKTDRRNERRRSPSQEEDRRRDGRKDGRKEESRRRRDRSASPQRDRRDRDRDRDIRR
ncbi:peptidyl-prolyl cis-trans isomerase-like 4 [Littorina saxatilis]|uniref:Peptidyl-prolyl cis-trans isomerase n=1 Tax=Littorina saxatilis TaxID=31220 RepID=A0AAN9GI99_9CAEN